MSKSYQSTSIKLIIFCKLFFSIQSSNTNDTIQQYIYYGREANPGQFPFQLALEYMSRFICGGVLIKNNLALTAAHCVREECGKYLSVRAGSIYQLEGGCVRKVCEIIVHPDYVKWYKGNDIAILKLCQKFNTNNRYIRTIPLMTNEPEPNSKATISGWGRTEYGTLSKILKYTTEIIQSREYCDRSCYVTKNDICVRAEGGESPCFGDFGGPLVVDGKLAGILSRGYGTCGHDGIIIYTNVAKYKYFIRKYIFA